MLTTSPSFFYICFLIYKIHSFIYHPCTRHILVPKTPWAVEQALEKVTFESEEADKPIGKVLSTVINAIERVNLDEELEREGAGGKATPDDLTEKKPAMQTGESVSGQGNIKGKGSEAHGNKIINHFTKAY